MLIEIKGEFKGGYLLIYKYVDVVIHVRGKKVKLLRKLFYSNISKFGTKARSKYWWANIWLKANNRVTTIVFNAMLVILDIQNRANALNKDIYDTFILRIW